MSSQKSAQGIKLFSSFSRSEIAADKINTDVCHRHSYLILIIIFIQSLRGQ